MACGKRFLIWLPVVAVTLVNCLTCAAPVAAQSAPIAALPTGFPGPARWISHVNKEIMPFWMLPSAQGTPLGNFPSVRCNDGSLINYAAPCDEVNIGYLLQKRTSVVTLSRQTYGYCMAFHMTGNPAYLRLAKAGAVYLRKYAMDRVNGGVHSYRDDQNGQWDSDYKVRTTQELAYALQGLSCYHYITRDPNVLTDVLAVKNFIFRKYWNASAGMLQWQLADGNGNKALDRMLVAQLDQLTYMPLIAQDLPAAAKKQWVTQMARIADVIRTRFFARSSGLFFTRANGPDDLNNALTATDFGHNAKILWNFRLIGRIANRPDLVSFSRQLTGALLQRAFMPSPGTWATGLNAGGSVNGEKSWWIHAELDQLAAVASLSNVNHTLRLGRAYAYWLNYFVDHAHGEVWTSIAADSNQPAGLLAKSWYWKNAFHSIEHSFFGYVTSSKLVNKPAILYYAFLKAPLSSTVRPYYFSGKLNGMTSRALVGGGRVYRASFSNIGF